MPEYYCVRCYSCKTYQSVTRTKSAQYRCRICRTKQFYRHTYATSTVAKDVRIVVQQRNAERDFEDSTPKKETPADSKDEAAPLDAPKKDENPWCLSSASRKRVLNFFLPDHEPRDAEDDLTAVQGNAEREVDDGIPKKETPVDEAPLKAPKKDKNPWCLSTASQKRVLNFFLPDHEPNKSPSIEKTTHSEGHERTNRLDVDERHNDTDSEFDDLNLHL